MKNAERSTESFILQTLFKQELKCKVLYFDVDVTVCYITSPAICRGRLVFMATFSQQIDLLKASSNCGFSVKDEINVLSLKE